MSKRRKTSLAAAAALVLAAGAGGVAMATGGGEGDETVSGPAADRATEAALAITGGGEANSVERDDENGATWEVEVTKTDGETVDVRLDEQFGEVVVESDSEDAEESADEADER